MIFHYLICYRHEKAGYVSDGNMVLQVPDKIRTEQQIRSIERQIARSVDAPPEKVGITNLVLLDHQKTAASSNTQTIGIGIADGEESSSALEISYDDCVANASATQQLVLQMLQSAAAEDEPAGCEWADVASCIVATAQTIAPDTILQMPVKRNGRTIIVFRVTRPPEDEPA